VIVSKKLRASAGHHNAYCTLQIVGVCGDATDSKTAGCVLAHIRLPGEVGGAQKPDDVCACLACGPCHTAFDSNGTTKGLQRGSEEWLFYAIRGMARTLRFWHDNGFLEVR
jgi:hypothetical protein